MTVHFAASRLAAHSPIARILRRPRSTATAANDNGEDQGDDRLLFAALQHFGRHGLGAAREARRQAEHAFFTGDRDRYNWWLGICRKLDKRLANTIERAAASGVPTQRPASEA